MSYDAASIALAEVRDGLHKLTPLEQIHYAQALATLAVVDELRVVSARIDNLQGSVLGIIDTLRDPA